MFKSIKKILKINTSFGEGIKEQYINIESDDNFADVISLLDSKNLLVDVNSFKWVADKKNYINNIKAGRYFINKSEFIIFFNFSLIKSV